MWIIDFGRLSSQLVQVIAVKGRKMDLEGFSGQIGVHLSASLSHINPDIQRDSLFVLDAIIDQVPAVILDQHERLLPNCISQLNSGSLINEKVTLVQWRSDVLKRIVEDFGHCFCK